MLINFMDFENESDLRLAIEQQLPIGSATVEDVLVFCRENQLNFGTPVKIGVRHPEAVQKYELSLGARTKAPTGAREFFRLSNWKLILKNIFRIWLLLFIVTDWIIVFYFNNGILSAIDVQRISTSF